MKGVKVNLKKGCKSWVFNFYDSSESAFYIKNFPSQYDNNNDYIKKISLKSGESMEIIWMGSEWVYTENSHERYDKIYIKKFTPITGSKQWDVYVDTFTGWICGDTLDWSCSSQKGINLISLNNCEEYTSNIRLFFQDGNVKSDDFEIGDVLN